MPFVAVLSSGIVANGFLSSGIVANGSKLT